MADVEEVRRDAAFDNFDAVCKRDRLTPAQLEGLADDDLAERVKPLLPERMRNLPMDLKYLRRVVREYAAEEATSAAL